MKTKTLYNFKASKEVEVEKTHLSKDENGQEVKTIKKVKEVVDFEYAIKKPNRALFDEAELFYGIRLSEAIKAGVLTKAAIVKRYENDGGVFSDKEHEMIKNNFIKIAELQTQYKILEEKKNKSDAEKIEENNILSKINEVRNELIELESQKASIFEQTAENRARNKTIMWWILNLSLKKNGEEYEYIFGDGSYEEKLKKYDEIEENDDEYLKLLLLRFAYLISFWYTGRAQSQKDFESIDSDQTSDINRIKQEAKEEQKQDVKEEPKEGAKEEPKQDVKEEPKIESWKT